LSRVVVCSSLVRAPHAVRHLHAFAAARAFEVTDSPRQNFFAANDPKRRSGGRFGTQNARIGAGDSLRRCRWRQFATPRGCREREIFATLGACARLARRNFPHVRAPMKVALRCRDVS
jgi:hypothetical protein